MLISGTKAKSCGLVAAFATAAALCGGAAYAADMDTMVTKAPPPPAAFTPPAPCGSLNDFFLTACPLTWSGVTFYGTVDMGGTYQTHGTPFDRNFPTGASYLLGAGGGSADGRTAGFGLGPNAMSQSNVGIKIIEPIAPGGWSFISQNELAFDPYSLLLSNAPQAMQNGIGLTQTQALLPYNSSRWGWLAATNVVGVSQPVFGTLTFGRQNDLNNDSLSIFDPFAAAYAFSLIGYSGKMAGGGGTEEARWTTAIKYRVNVGDLHFAVEGQPIGGTNGGYNSYNPNNGAIAGEAGWNIKNVGPGVLSLNVIGMYVRDAVNIGPAGWGTNAATGLGTGIGAAYLKATLSDNTSFVAEAKYSFGSWGNTPPPVVGKAPPVPSGPTGIPLTLYAGYEWIQLANPSDTQTSFRDDGFLFVNPNTTNTGGAAGFNGTAINNNAFNGSCGAAGGGCTAEIFQYAWVGAKYGITRDLDLIGAYYLEWQETYAVNGALCAVATLHGYCAGSMDVFSAALDWRFLPKWDTYIGLMYSVAYGGIANGDLYTNNLAVTGGVRFRF